MTVTVAGGLEVRPVAMLHLIEGVVRLATVEGDANAEGPAVTVAVSTRNRAGMLPRLVGALEGQTLESDRFEVVIADDGSTDRTPETLSELRRSSRVRLRTVRSPGHVGRAAGRNLAWRAGAAPVVAFTDDDCVPDARWLEEGLAALDDGHRVVVGRTEPDPTADWGPFVRTMQVRSARHFPTCNAFYRRVDLEAVGGFDQAFTGKGGEDTDLALRVLGLGGGAEFASEALVHHDVHVLGLPGALREASSWTGIPRLYAKHPDRREDLAMGVFWKRTHPRALLALAAIVLAPRQPLAGLLAVPWVRMRTTRDRPIPPHAYLLSLPGRLLVDLAEVVAMLRGSVEHRTLVL